MLEKLRTSIFSLITSISFSFIRSRMCMQFLYHPTAVAYSHSYKNASKVRRTLVTCSMQYKVLWLSVKITKFYVTAKAVECMGLCISSYDNQGQILFLHKNGCWKEINNLFKTSLRLFSNFSCADLMPRIICQISWYNFKAMGFK